MATLIYPLFETGSFFDTLDNTTLDEGDIFRLLNQIMDRINQLERAVYEPELQQRLRDSYAVIKNSLMELE